MTPKRKLSHVISRKPIAETKLKYTLIQMTTKHFLDTIVQQIISIDVILKLQDDQVK